jgi:hypothetical protein
MVSESAEETGFMLLQVPSQTPGALNGACWTPAPVAGQAAPLATIVPGRKHAFCEGEQVHAEEHVTMLGGVSRYPVTLLRLAASGQAGGVVPSGPDQTMTWNAGP